MQILIATLAYLAGTIGAAVAMLALIGVGILRDGPVWLVAFAAVALVFLPARALSTPVKKEARRIPAAPGTALFLWSVAMLIAFPLYFPGERGGALSLGFSAVEPWTDGHLKVEWAKQIDDWLPAIKGTRTVPKEAATETIPKPPPVEKTVVRPPSMPAEKPPPAATVPGDQVVLPTEGHRGSLRVPVTVEGPRRQVETSMIFDTGATITTLDRATLRQIGVRIPDDAPVMKVHTAAGPRETRVVLLERLWVGGLEVEGVTVSVCDACATGEAVGLLGLNVSERFLVTVDGAREELVLAPRAGATNRGVDVSPWIDLEAEATRWPDGRTEVTLEAENTSARWIERLTVAIQCDQTRYADLRDIGPGQVGHVEVSISSGTNCERFQVSIDSAIW
jgi:predicted aspartyl protease